MGNKPHNWTQIFALFLVISAVLYSFNNVVNGASQATSHVFAGGNSGPEISNVKINNNSPIVLTANTTTLVYVSYSLTDANGCAEVFPNGGVTTTLYRSDLGSGCSFSYNSCYIESTTTYSCVGSSTTADATTTVSVYYFADATDASSSYPASTWVANVLARDSSGATGTATSTGVELNTLTAITLGTSTINYGRVAVGGNTGATNQELPIVNVGNSSSSLQLNGTAMTSGSITIPTSSQHYATGTFSYGGTEQLLSATAQTISGWLTDHGPQIRSWQNTTPLPVGIVDISTVSFKNFAYSIGGAVGIGQTSTVRFAPINATGSIGTWQNTTALPFRIDAHSSVVWGDYIYVIGGSNDLDTSGTSTVRFAPINATGSIGTWQNTTALPFRISSHSSVVWGDYIYVVGGFSDGDNTSTVLFASINPTGSISYWQTTTPLTSSRFGLDLVVGGRYLYAIAGTDVFPPTSTVSSAYLNSNGSLGSWQNTTALPDGLNQFSAELSNDFIFVIAGNNDNIFYTSTLRFAPIFSSGTIGRWQNGQQLHSVGLARFGSFINNGYLYVLGGDSGPYGYTSTVSYAKLNSQNLYWGLGIPSGIQNNLTFTGLNTLTAIFAP